MSTDDEVENPFPTQEQRVDKIKKVQIIKPGEIDEGKKKPLSVRVERFFDRHNHKMEFLRTVFGLTTIALQVVILAKIFGFM
tara:strand:+ start:30958 stop:31203 length:246 start_codon:yes stop_codon:yes gene_type:complete